MLECLILYILYKWYSWWNVIDSWHHDACENTMFSSGMIYHYVYLYNVKSSNIAAALPCYFTVENVYYCSLFRRVKLFITIVM